MEKKFFKNPVTYVGEVQLHVTRLKESLSFYQDIIGFSVLEKSNRKAVLTADGITPLLTIEQPENVVSKQMGRTGLYHFAILLPSRKDLASFLKYCFQYNIPFGSADHAVSEALYLSDPDGNGIEVYHDRPSTEWNWIHDQVTMVTESLDINGILAETSDHWIKASKGNNDRAYAFTCSQFAGSKKVLCRWSWLIDCIPISRSTLYGSWKLSSPYCN
jgi:catechol 2,3-dioxygenase